MNLDWKHWVIIGVVVVLIATLGGLKIESIKEKEELTKQITTLSDSLAIQKTMNETLKKSSKKGKTMTPVQMPNGQIAYITTETSETVEEAMRQATEQVAQLKSQVTTLEVALKTKESLVIKTAPFWNIVAGWEPMGQAYYAGGGINLGPISVSVDNPVALDLRPRLSAMIRF